MIRCFDTGQQCGLEVDEGSCSLHKRRILPVIFTHCVELKFCDYYYIAIISMEYFLRILSIVLYYML